MMKKVAFIFLAFSLFACGETKKESTEEVQATTEEVVADSVVVADTAAVVADSVAVDSAATEEVVEEAAQ